MYKVIEYTEVIPVPNFIKNKYLLNDFHVFGNGRQEFKTKMFILLNRFFFFVKYTLKGRRKQSKRGKSFCMREVKYHEDDKEEKVKKKATGEQPTQKMAYE